jgi:hypothetical protein
MQFEYLLILTRSAIEVQNCGCHDDVREVIDFIMKSISSACVDTIVRTVRNSGFHKRTGVMGGRGRLVRSIDRNI